MTDTTEERLRTAIADRYAIESKLGEGGMALVYLAKDLKHDRSVAVKILRPELAASLGTDRFLREIQHTAKLSHPHILPLYDSGAADGFLFYVMPFVEGESLSDMLEREKQLSIPDAVRITREVAEALAVAHSRGLVHRDIKPDNIMMTGGHAVVADFGIARAVEEAGGDKLTQTGMAVGTPAYMSPEQAAGDSNVDGRSDVYSLGCVLYELLVGQVPFTGPTPMAVMARHTMDNLPAPSIMRQSIPPELEDVIYCAMAKTPADRFKTAGEMAEALNALESGGLLHVRQTAAHVRQTMAHTRPTRAFVVQQPAWRRALVPAAVVGALVLGGIVGWQVLGGDGTNPAGGLAVGGLDPSRIAVLYFEDRSSNGEWQYLADGLTEGLIDNLTDVTGLSVISSNGVAQLRSSELPRDSIARMLNVGSIVVGSVEQEGSGVRVTTRLVEGQGGTDLDRASFRIPADQLLASRDSVVETVSRFLRRRLGEEVTVRERMAETSSVEAWGLEQRAKRLRKDAAEVRRQDVTAATVLLTHADSVLELAESADPGWLGPIIARGWVAYDRAMTIAAATPLDAVPWFETGLEHAERALVMKPGDADALALRGTLRFRLYRVRAPVDPQGARPLLLAAREDLEAAVRANRRLAEAQITLSYLYYDLNEVPLAQLAARTALDLDAYLLNADNVIHRLFWSSWDLEQFNQARNWCSQGAARFPRDYRFVGCQIWLMASPAISQPDPSSAWRLLGSLDSLSPEGIRAFAMLEGEILVGAVLGRTGHLDSARAVLERVQVKTSHDVDPEQELVTRQAYARTFMADQDKDAAIELLLQWKAANPHHGFEETAGTIWTWRPLRDRPRFSELTNPDN